MTATVAHVAWGVALAAIVGADGSPGWRVVRVAVVALLTVGGVLASRTDRRGRSAPAIAHGIAGLAVGAGIGVRHATEEGISLDTVAGLVALAAGVVLLIGGLRVLVDGLGRWPRRLAFTASLLGALLVAFNAFPAVMVTNVPELALGDARPAVDHTEVTFDTGDGVRLAGWYAPSRNGAAVVLRHGAGSTRSSLVAHMTVLVRHGYGVLATDARGHGESGGRAMDFGWYGDRDLTAAVTFLAEQPGVDGERLGVVGLSMGGEEAIGAAAADRRIRAVVAEGATGRQAGDDAWLSEKFGVRGWIQRGFEWTQDVLTGVLTSAPRPIALHDAIRDATGARFLVVAAGDVEEEQHVADHLRDVAPRRVRTWTVDGAAHTDGLAVDRAGWTERVTSFLDDALR